MKKILLLVGVMMMLFSYGQNRSDYYWSGYGSSDDISDGINWWTDGNPSSGDNLYFNNTEGVRHWAYSNYGVGSYFGSLITYNGAGGIKFYGDNTYAYKFENNSDVELFELSPNSAAEGSREIGNRIDNNLEINPVGSGGILVSCDKISMDNTNGSRTLKVYGGNTLTIDGFIYEKNGTGASFQLLGSATVIIKGNSTYTGATTVSGGTLELQGSIASSAVTVESGATLKINGDDVTLASLDVEPGGVVTIEAGKSLTVTGAFSNSGTVTVKSTSSATGSLITNGTVTVNVTVESYLAQDVFHYIASPINYSSGSFNDLSLGLTAGEGNDDFRKYETSSNTWIDILNGNGAGSLMGSETFVIGKGYAIAYAGENKTISLTGTLNDGDIDVAVSSGGVGNNSGANLIGNPYPSTMKVSAFLAANNSTNGTINTTIGGTLYFWDEPASGSFEKGDYAYRTSTTGTPGGGNKTPTDYINPGQGFFVSASSDGNVAFRNTQREHGISVFFKSESIIKDFKLSVQNIATSDMNTVTVVFDVNSTTGFDALYDAPKWQGNPDLALYSLLGDQKLAIQSLPSIEEQNTVALGLNVSKTGDYLFNVHTLLNFDASTPIFLEDKQTEDIIDLTVNPEYVFNVSESGVINDRFVLHFGTITDIDEAVSMEKPSIYVSGNTLHILNLYSDYTLRITDITGRVLVEEQQSANQTLQLPASMNTGVYVVEMTSENQRFTQKLFVR